MTQRLHLLHPAREICWRRSRGSPESGRFDYLLIESTGISEPMPVAATFEFRATRMARACPTSRGLDTMVTVVDAVNFLRDYGSRRLASADRGEVLGDGRSSHAGRPAGRADRVRRRHRAEQDRCGNPGAARRPRLRPCAHSTLDADTRGELRGHPVRATVCSTPAASTKERGGGSACRHGRSLVRLAEACAGDRGDIRHQRLVVVSAPGVQLRSRCVSTPSLRESWQGVIRCHGPFLDRDAAETGAAR